MILDDSANRSNTQVVMLASTCLGVQYKLAFLIELFVKGLVVMVDIYLG